MGAIRSFSASVLAVLLSTSVAVASDDIPVLKPGLGYGAARGLLISKGFQPVRSGNQRDDRCSAGRQDVCVAYPETVSCDGTGAAACRFIFSSRTGVNVTVVADGNDAGHLKVVTSRRAAVADAQWQRRAP
jgi:hypothetical protein